MLAAILGAGPVADAFFVALRLPNHFRAIFAEGAFNAAFVPAYAHVHGKSEASAKLFANRIFTLLFAAQVILLVVAWLFMPQVIAHPRPRFCQRSRARPTRDRPDAHHFPLPAAGHLGDALWRHAQRDAPLCQCCGRTDLPQFVHDDDAGARGILSGRGLCRGLGRADLPAFSNFPCSPDAWRSGILPRFAPLKLDEDIRAFFRALGPATIGSMGTQIALFADTIIATFLAAGALSALYYADRLNQLPIGVIGIAMGTVLLPEMSRRLAAGDFDGAAVSQRKAFDFTLLLSVPFVAAFIAVPDTIMRAMFARGAFTKGDAAAAGATLAAYAIGLIPFVLIRSAVATFYARKDTASPVKAALTGVAVNVALKLALVGSLAQIGLAFATAVGAWINLLLVIGFAVRAGYLALDRALINSFAKFAVAAAILGAVLWSTARFAPGVLQISAFRDEATLGLLIVVGAAVYAASILVLFGRRWLISLVR